MAQTYTLFVETLFSSTGKTTWCEKLLESNIVQKKFRNIVYVFPYELDNAPGIKSTLLLNRLLLVFSRLGHKISQCQC